MGLPFGEPKDMTKDFDLTVTICSWNTLKQTQKCLEHLAAEKESAAFEVIVIDNGSSDGSAEMIESKFPWVQLIKSPQNLGFAGGHNECIRRRKGKDVFLLNSDAYVHPGSISQLIDFRASHPEAGIFGPKLLNPDGSLQYSCRAFPNPVATLFRNSLIGKLFPNAKLLNEYLMKDWDHNSVRNVDWVSGAAFYVTEAVIERVGLFDEAYFMYCEDVDWCWRARKSGFEVAYCPTSVVTHEIGTSSSKAVAKMIIRFHRSMFRFYQKNELADRPWFSRSALLAFAFLALTGRALLLLIRTGITSLFQLAFGKGNRGTTK